MTTDKETGAVITVFCTCGSLMLNFLFHTKDCPVYVQRTRGMMVKVSTNLTDSE